MRGELELVEQDVAQLGSRVDVELLARELLHFFLEALRLRGELVADRPQPIDVDCDPRNLHLGEHADERALHVLVESSRTGLLQGLADPGNEPAEHRHLRGRMSRVRRCRLRFGAGTEVRFVLGAVEIEAELLLGHRGLETRNSRAERRHEVRQTRQRGLSLAGVEKVGGDGGVEIESGEMDPLRLEGAHQLLRTVGDDPPASAFSHPENRLQGAGDDRLGEVPAVQPADEERAVTRLRSIR